VQAAAWRSLQTASLVVQQQPKLYSTHVEGPVKEGQAFAVVSTFKGSPWLNPGSSGC